MKNMCAKCPKRETCVELCDICEEYANQDYVSQQEYIGSFPVGDNVKDNIDWDIINFNNKNILRNIILKMHFEDKMTASEIASYLPVEYQYVVEITKRQYKDKKEKIIELWKEGLSLRKIAKVFSCRHSYIHKVIGEYKEKCTP